MKAYGISHGSLYRNLRIIGCRNQIVYGRTSLEMVRACVSSFFFSFTFLFISFSGCFSRSYSLILPCFYPLFFIIHSFYIAYNFFSLYSVVHFVSNSIWRCYFVKQKYASVKKLLSCRFQRACSFCVPNCVALITNRETERKKKHIYRKQRNKFCFYLYLSKSAYGYTNKIPWVQSTFWNRKRKTQTVERKKNCEKITLHK